MANISSSNFTNITNKLTNIGNKGEVPNALYEINSIITVIINSITCPLTVLLNMLVIMAVKRRPRLQSNTNILLACLATTDVFTGLAVQPSFIVWKIYVELLEEDQSSTAAPEEVERFAKESKALKTTVFIVGAVVLCFAPVVLLTGRRLGRPGS
ncbi:hypothetical protein ACROYT_G026546 [Oculina patagonica]